MNDEADRIEQGVLVAVIAIMLLVCSALSVRADGFTVSVESRPLFEVTTENPWLPPPPVTAAAMKPVVFVAYAPFKCPPCDIQKRDLKDFKSDEFVINVPDKFPIEVPYYPYTAWQDGNGKWWHLEQWSGTKDLISRWKGTRGEKQKPAFKATTNNYNPRWTWPGNLIDHLRTTHGVTDAMTQDQAEAVHDALHEGHSISQIRAYAKRHGYTK